MENRKLRKEPVRDDAPVQLKGRDFEPLQVTEPKKDDPPKPFDCKGSYPSSAPRHRGKRS